MATRYSIGPFIKGMNTLSNETSLPQEQCRSARNIDFDKDGNYEQREGFVKLITATNVHSLYPSSNSAILFGCQKNNIGIFNLSTSLFTSKATMPSAFRTSWAYLDSTIYASNPAFNCRFDPATYIAYNIAVPLIDPPTITASTSGGMNEGTYTVTYSILNSSNEESGTGVETQVDITEGGGIVVSGLPIDATSKIRIFASHPHGEELYRVLEAPLTAASLSIGIHEFKSLGAQPETRFLEEIPKGHFITNYSSRLFIAFDNFLAFSSSFRPHLWDPRYNFIPFESLITMVAPVESGIFVSDLNSVKFLRGGDPERFEIIDVDSDPAYYGSVSIVPGAHLASDMAQYDSVAIWLSKTGHQIGLPDGSVLRANPGQLDLPSYSITSSVFSIQNGIKQVIIPVNSSQRNGTGTAVDSEIF